MIGEDRKSARLEGGEHLAVHEGTVDRHVSRVVVVEEKRDEIEIVDARRDRIIERPDIRHYVFHGRRLQPRLEGRLRLFAEIRRVLAIHNAVRRDGARHQLGAVTAAGAHIEHFHSWANPSKFQKGQRIAPFVGLLVRGAAIRRRNKLDIIGRLRPEWAKKWAKNKSEHRDQTADSERSAHALCDHYVLQDFDRLRLNYEL